MTPLVPIFSLCVLALSAEESIQLKAFDPKEITPFMIHTRAFAHGAAHAALCGELRLQIVSSVALDVGVIVTALYHYQQMLSVGSIDFISPPGLALVRIVAMFLVAQWLALFGTNTLIWKGLKPLTRSMDTRNTLPI